MTGYHVKRQTNYLSNVLSDTVIPIFDAVIEY